MKQFFNNLPAVIYCRWTHPDLLVHELLEFAVLPLDVDFTISKKHTPFHAYIKPQMTHYDKRYCKMRDYRNSHTYGSEAVAVRDMFLTWYDSLKLIANKSIMPLGFQTALHLNVFQLFLGPDTYRGCFHYYIRDLQSASLFTNDWAGFNHDPYPFQKNTLSFILARMGMYPKENDCMSRCRQIREAYSRMLGLTHIRTPELLSPVSDHNDSGNENSEDGIE